MRRLTRRISLGGLMTAFVFLSVFAAYLSPTADLALFSLASLAIAIAVVELDLCGAWIVFLASVLVGLAYPGLAATYPLLAFFGPYPLIRALLDSRFSRLPARLLCLLAGNLLAALAFVLFAWPMTAVLAEKTGGFFWPVLILGLQIALLTYDYALGLLIQFYMLRLRKR
jgi:hypothetical protein